MKPTFEELKESLMGQKAMYRIEVRGENNQGPVDVPVTIVDVRRQYGRTDVQVELDPPASGRVWASLNRIILREKETLDVPHSRE